MRRIASCASTLVADPTEAAARQRMAAAKIDAGAATFVADAADLIDRADEVDAIVIGTARSISTPNSARDGQRQAALSRKARWAERRPQLQMLADAGRAANRSSSSRFRCA